MVSENPYFNRQTIHNDRYFFGRQAELRKVFSLIGAASPQCVSVVGERRVGKSSFLLHLARDTVYREYLPDPDRYVLVYIGLGEKGGMAETELWADIAREILEKSGSDLGGKRTTGKEAGESVAAAYERVKVCVEQLQQRGRVLILLMDEFEEIVRSEEFGPDGLGRLRALTNTYDVAIVTSTKVSLADTCHRTRFATSPFFNVFGSPVTLGALDPHGVKSLVVGLSEEAGCPLEPEYEWIRDLAGDSPYVLQVVCANAFELRTQWGKTSGEDLTPGEQEEVAKASCDQAVGVFEVMWSGFSDEAREALRLAARSKELPERLERTTTDLERRGLLKDGKIRSRLFGKYILGLRERRQWDLRTLLVVLVLLVVSAAFFFGTYYKTEKWVEAVGAVLLAWGSGGLLKWVLSQWQAKGKETSAADG